MTDREEVCREILNLARPLVAEGGDSMALASSLSGAALSGTVGAAKEMFLEVFVNQALDQVAATLDADKAYIAEAAANFANAGVEALKHGVSRLKVTLGLPPVPGN